MQVNRIILMVLDSVGIGELPDAADFGDVGSHTLGNMARAVGGLNVPHLAQMGLGNIAVLDGVVPQEAPSAAYGKLAEVSAGKDTTTGHWELMGLPLSRPFPLYPDGFPDEVMDAFEQAIGRGTLGNYPASGTEILEELGEKHMLTGYPIVYTSGDSVFQIAAHEEVIPVAELYEICEKARAILRGDHEVSRVIARPFVGTPGNWTRTANRHDYSVVPPAPTLLNTLQDAGLSVHAIGKINDIFVGEGITSHVTTRDNMDGIDQTLAALADRPDRGLIFTNLVDFDALYGHRNNPQGYADALAAFDARLPELLDALAPDDVLILTADHGNDPTTPSTDHSREYVPLLLAGDLVQAGQNLGVMATFADVAATIAEAFGVARPSSGHSFRQQALKTFDNSYGKDLLALLGREPVQVSHLIDHTLLKATATPDEVAQICDEALEYQFASVCVNPSQVAFVAEKLANSAVKVCTVVGFPLGATTTADKVTETRNALANGAQEIDMVINIGALKAGNVALVEAEISAVAAAAHAGGAICKVIIETSYLTDVEKVAACKAAVRANADYVKTSTGFSGGGATEADVALMRQTVGAKAGVKASGGVRSFKDAQTMVSAGANRIGASSGVAIVKAALGETVADGRSSGY